jgi:hypothetical protein
VFPTPTLTPAAGWGSTFDITETLIYNNPYKPASGPLTFSVDISKPAAELKVRIYTTAYRRVLEVNAGPSNTRDVIITIPQWKISRLAAGTYYIVVSGAASGGEKALSKPAVLVVFK